MLKACIFDLGGTVVDRYSLSPFLSLKEAFKLNNLIINQNLIFNDMGMDKREHIQKILKDKYVHRNFVRNEGRFVDNNDVHQIYSDFNDIQLCRSKIIDIIPETKEIFSYLKEKNILIGVNTGFNREITENIMDVLTKEGIHIDEYVSSSCLDLPGRPQPHMINHLMDKFKIDNPDQVMKIDDTNVGVKEGKNAKCISIGVARWSTYMKVRDKYEIRGLTDDDINHRLINSKKELKKSNPDSIIDNLTYIPDSYYYLKNKLL
jgi:phosphonoacetaldehyde hydrolase